MAYGYGRGRAWQSVGQGLVGLGQTAMQLRGMQQDEARQTRDDARQDDQDRLWREELNRRTARERQGDVLDAYAAGGGEGPVPTSASSRINLPEPDFDTPALGLGMAPGKPASTPLGRWGQTPTPDLTAPPPAPARNFDPLGEAMADPHWGKKYVGAGENLYIEEPDSRGRRLEREKTDEFVTNRPTGMAVDQARALGSGYPVSSLPEPPEAPTITLDGRRFPDTPEGREAALAWQRQTSDAGRAPTGGAPTLTQANRDQALQIISRYKSGDGVIDWDAAVSHAIDPTVREEILRFRNQAGAFELGFSGPTSTGGGDDVDAILQGLFEDSPAGPATTAPTSRRPGAGYGTPQATPATDPRAEQRAEWDRLASVHGRQLTEQRIGPRP